MTGLSTADPHSSRRHATRADTARMAVRNVERPLADAELFFSTTNAKGVITAGNAVFERVSGYPLSEMIGRPHNIVRHPDMPRAVFAVLWETIAAGRPVAAYVRNRAADGAYYWVLASVVPISDGYLSVRLAPGSEQLATAKKIYSDLVAIERETEGDDVRQRKPSIAASLARLGELLSQAGYEDYHAFMRAALPAEVARRASRLPDGHREQLATAPPAAAARLVEILTAYRSISDFLAHLVTDLGRYAQIGRALADQSSYLNRMGGDVRLFALNAQIGASRLGEQGAALDAVARLLTEQSQATSPLVATVAERAAKTVREIEEMTFQLSVSTMQAEMIAVFAHELTNHPECRAAARNMLSLSDALQRGSERTFAALGTTADHLSDIIDRVEQVAVAISRLSRLSLNGRVEVADVPDAGSISRLFSDVERQVNEARRRLTEFGTIREAAHDLHIAAGDDAVHTVARLHDSAAALAAAPARD